MYGFCYKFTLKHLVYPAQKNNNSSYKIQKNLPPFAPCWATKPTKFAKFRKTHAFKNVQHFLHIGKLFCTRNGKKRKKKTMPLFPYEMTMLYAFHSKIGTNASARKPNGGNTMFCLELITSEWKQRSSQGVHKENSKLSERIHK